MHTLFFRLLLVAYISDLRICHFLCRGWANQNETFTPRGLSGRVDTCSTLLATGWFCRCDYCCLHQLFARTGNFMVYRSQKSISIIPYHTPVNDINKQIHIFTNKKYLISNKVPIMVIDKATKLLRKVWSSQAIQLTGRRQHICTEMTYVRCQGVMFGYKINKVLCRGYINTRSN